MSDPPAPSEPPDDSGDDQPWQSGQPNPFAGTPFEQMFSAFAAGQGGSGPGDMPDLSALLSQVQQMLQPYEGPVNWPMAEDLARRAIAEHPGEPGDSERDAVDVAVSLAELWLDEVCSFPASASRATAWSRGDWVEKTLPSWRQIFQPVAGHVTTAIEHAIPEEIKAMAGPAMEHLTRAGGSLFGAQVGQALGALSQEVLSSTEIGLPLSAHDEAGLIVENIGQFEEGLDVKGSDVLIYLALRECAHQRLFHHATWLRSHLMHAIEDYARGMRIDISSVERSLSSFDVNDLQSLQQAIMSGDLYEPEQTSEQQAALDRLETMLALVEGWVDDLVGEATKYRMPNAAKLQEAIRRRRAAGGPAENTFLSLVGLELRPKRMRDAAALWGALRSAKGMEARDAVWAHPDLMPTSEDLDDPLGFAAGSSAGDQQGLPDAEFDAALADLLDTPSDESAAPPGAADEPPDEDAGDESDDDK
ncbi:MAG: hydrolase [Propionibacteriales bacterium]|nr:hydrolase [Propionibacteriales bacterium]